MRKRVLWVLLMLFAVLGMACDEDDSNVSDASNNGSDTSGTDTSSGSDTASGTDTSSLQTGQMQITISGGHFSEPTTYTLIDPEQSAYVFDTSFSILYTGGTTVTGSDGETTLDSFTFSAPERSGEGGYTASEFEFQFNITGLTGEDVTLSFADEEEDGSLTVETSSDGILAGTFESDARVTQMDETEPVYHIVGSFRFAY